MVLVPSLILVGFYALAYWCRDDAFILTVATAVGTLAVMPLLAGLTGLLRGFFWATFLASTLYRRQQVRVSLAYFVSIPLDDEQLLVRGQRIGTQFQPVGGVFKRRPEADQIMAKLGVRADPRFKSDDVNKFDLRLSLPGRNLRQLLAWFDSQKDREIFPWREVYEELISPGLLDGAAFAYFDCSFVGRCHLPFRLDRYSGMRQLIVADVYRMHPSDEQRNALRELRERVLAGNELRVMFATSEQIRRGGEVDQVSATTFDIPETAKWLVDR
jgi:hypothetical protein